MLQEQTLLQVYQNIGSPKAEGSGFIQRELLISTTSLSLELRPDVNVLDCFRLINIS